MTTKISIEAEHIAPGVTIQVTAKSPGPGGAIHFTTDVSAGQCREFYIHSHMELLVQEVPANEGDHG